MAQTSNIGADYQTDAKALGEQWAQRVSQLFANALPTVRQNAVNDVRAHVINRYIVYMSSGYSSGQAIAQVEQDANAMVQSIAQGARVSVPQSNTSGNTNRAGTASAVTSKDVADATGVFRDAVADGRGLYEGIRDYKHDPSAFGFVQDNKVTPGTVEAQTVTGPAQPLVAARQAETTVGGADLSDLQATARGEGAGQKAAAARYNQLLFRNAQAANARAQQARGYDRRGERRAALLQSSEAALAGGAKIAEIDASTSLQAQGQVAELERQKLSLQAQLDSARKAGDADREQDIRKKIADIDIRIKEFNATAKQKADESNVRNKQDADTTNLQQGRAAIEQDFNTWKGTNELALKAQEALENSAKNLLDEDQRQVLIKWGEDKLRLAEEEFEEMKRRNARQEELQAQQQKLSFWTTFISTLVAKTIPGPSTGAAHGGIVTKPTVLEVGEGGHAEIIIPIKGTVTERMARLLAVDAKPFEASGKDREIDTPKDLANAIKATLKTLKAKKKQAEEEQTDDMATMMAAAVLRARKERAA